LKLRLEFFHALDKLGFPIAYFGKGLLIVGTHLLEFRLALGEEILHILLGFEFFVQLKLHVGQFLGKGLGVGFGALGALGQGLLNLTAVFLQRAQFLPDLFDLGIAFGQPPACVWVCAVRSSTCRVRSCARRPA
jgi:hypothetical protein